MTPFQCNETALHQPTAYCMLDTTDDKRIQCLLIGLATYFLLAAFMLDTKIGRYFISIAETIDLCRPGSAIASIVSTARRMKESVASYLSRKKPEGAIVPGVHPVLDFRWNTIWGSPRDILGSPEIIDPSVGPDK